MLAIEVEYLLGRAVATDPSQRDRAEWPPHPSRLFSALVDALHDVEDVAVRGRAEAALRWLERQPAPEIAASTASEVFERSVVKYFVPINDEPVDPKKIRAAVLTEQRTRQERHFPAVVPAEPRVTFVWPASEPSSADAAAIAELATRVPYLGHSSSLVRLSCPAAAPPTTLAPALASELVLRVPGPGRLDRLNAVHEARKADTYVQPPKGREVPYAPAFAAQIAHGPHGPMRVLVVEGASFGLSETAWVTARLRQALLAHFPVGAKAHEELTGHSDAGGRAVRPHLAFAPLANVDGIHSDGSLKGLAIIVPRGIEEQAAMFLETALSKLSSLVLGARGVLTVRSLDGGTGNRERRGRLHSLDARRYLRPSTSWATVTPLALSLHPKPLKGLTEEAIVARDLKNLGLPAAVSISLSNVSTVLGAPTAREFQRGELSALKGRTLRHAVVEFAEPVAGPLLVGAGRYMGFGLLIAKGAAS